MLTFGPFSVPDIDCNGSLYGLVILKRVIVYKCMHNVTGLLSTHRWRSYLWLTWTFDIFEEIALYITTHKQESMNSCCLFLFDLAVGL